MKSTPRLAIILACSAILCSSSARATEEDSTKPDSSAGLSGKYAKDYLVAAGTLSPDKKFAIIYPTLDASENKDAGDYLVSLHPFAVISKLDTKWPYFQNQSNAGLSAEWSKDGSVALVTLGSKWGPGEVFLFEFRDHKLARTTNLLAKMNELLLPDYRKAKAERYNEYSDFVFETEDKPIYKLEGSSRVSINAQATTDPKGASQGRIWKARLSATWDIAQAKFTSQTVKRLFAGVRKESD